MGQNQFSSLINPRQYVSPVDLDVYGKAKMLNEQNLQKIRQEGQDAINTIMSIPAMSPQDEKILQERVEELKQKVGKLSVSDLSNSVNRGSLNSLISEFSNDPHILGIAHRGYATQNELKTKKEYEMKGIKYISPALKQAEDYINNGAYLKDARFSKTGYVSPDLTKLQEAAQKIAPKKKEWVTLSNGERMQVEKQTKEDLSNTYYSLLAQDPNGQRYLDDMFETNFEGTDWENNGQQKLNEDIYELQNQIYEITSSGGDASLHEAHLNRLLNLQGKGLLGEPLKQAMKNDYIQEFVNDWADSVDYVNQGDIKLDELTKMWTDYKMDLNKETFKTLLPGLSAIDAKKQKEFLAGNFANITGDDISNMQLKANEIALNKKVTETEAVTSAREQAKLRIKNRNAKLTNPSIKGTEIFEIQGIQKNKSQWDSEIASITDSNKTTDNKAILALIKEQPELFSISQDELSKLSPEDLIINKITGEIQVDNPYIFTGNKVIGTKADLNTAFYGTALKNDSPEEVKTGRIDLGNGNIVEGKILQSISDSSSLNQGDYYIVNGIPYQKD